MSRKKVQVTVIGHINRLRKKMHRWIEVADDEGRRNGVEGEKRYTEMGRGIEWDGQRVGTDREWGWTESGDGQRVGMDRE